MTALVTGGAGFIGRRVVAELLARGESVRVLDDLSRARPGSLDAFAANPAFLGLVNADVTDASSVERAASGTDVIYHLAAAVAVGASVREPAPAIRTNVLGTLEVLEAARRNDLRVVHVSTCHVYAPAAGPLHESSATEPTSPYAASKLAAEQIVGAFRSSDGVRATIVRPFNVYGPWQRDDLEGGVVARFVRGEIAAAALEVHGDGRQTRDFLYVADCARGIVEAAGEPAVGRVINLATGVETSVAELAGLIAADPERVVRVPHPHPNAEVSRYVGDAARARELIGWSPEVALPDGLRSTRAWFEALADS